MTTPEVVRAARRLPIRTSVERLLLNAFVVFLVTFVVRATLFTFRYSVEPYIASPIIQHPSLVDVVGREASGAWHGTTQSAYVSGGGLQVERLMTPPPVHFSMSIATTEASTWREVVYWRERGFAKGTPYYLQGLALWYVRFIPAVLAKPPVTGLVLSAIDGLTAALISRWSSASSALLYGFFVLNPIMVLTTTSESITSFEMFLLTVTVDLCARRATSVVAYAGALICAFTLGSHFIAVPVVLLAPLGTPSYSIAFAVAAALTAGVGAYAVLYLYSTEASHRFASLYAPPDNGVMWYVRQLALPSFERCLELLMLQLASMLLIPAAVALPTGYFRQPSSSSAHQHLFTDGRIFLLLMAEGLSVLFRTQLTLPYCFLIILHFYSSLNPAATKTVTLKDQRVVTYSPYTRARLLVPIFIQLTSIPLEVSFYTGWVLRETANANWKFFSDVAFMVGATGFFVVWYAEVVEDAVLCEGDDDANLVACSVSQLKAHKAD
ncbi:GPI transamidase component Tta2, putative [Leishmania panamensis]|uniref:GPI transamidase component Tta2, putative n=1 Tax=Leishmania panamensis TaxID=5679 RepID=A0A088S3S4_LEIPA|nr:GPI transamidase component Tta2, putative [Leishmania panamensis]AIO02205.1 GPI transamidase component Tta2, putative [Leishmania panamensis]